MNPVNLSLERHYFKLPVSIQSLSVSSNFFEGMPFVYACVALTMSKLLQHTKANVFLHSQKIGISVLSGLPQTTVRMFVSIKKHRGHKKTIIPVARMLLIAIYNILKKNELHNHNLYIRSNAPPTVPLFGRMRLSLFSNVNGISSPLQLFNLF